jgi:ankyrin repeat protein
MIKNLLLILCLIISLSACKPQPENTPMTPDMAKNMLKLQGFNFDEKGYFDAIRQNDTTAIKAFFDAGINPNAVNDTKVPALSYAIQNCELKTVKALIEKCDLNLKDNNGNMPLHLALKSKKFEMFEALLEKGADVNSVGKAGSQDNQSVLYLAVIRDEADLIKRLLDKGANPNLLDSGGASPLNEVCAVSGNLEVAKMLIEKGADVNVKEPKDANALIYAIRNDNLTSENRVELVKMLLAKGADKNAKDAKGKNALDNAKASKRNEVIELLK